MKTGMQNRKRIWLGGGLVLALVIVLGGWFVFIDPERTDTASTRSDIASVQVQNTVLAAKNARLKAQNDDAAALRAGLAAALAELPSDGGLPAFTRQLSAQAAAHEVLLSGVIVGAASAVAAPAVAAPAATDPTATDAAPAATGAASTLMQTIVTVTATGLGRDLTAFLSDIQVAGPRRALVTATQLSPADDANGAGPDAAASMSLTLSVFSAPLTADDRAALDKLLSGS